MSILTLDLGKQTGWAILTDGIIESGSKGFHGSRFSGGGMCFLNFRNWLNSLKDISAVYFEEVRRHLGTDAAHCYGGFLAVLSAWCEEHHVPYNQLCFLKFFEFSFITTFVCNFVFYSSKKCIFDNKNPNLIIEKFCIKQQLLLRSYG
ncbi:hypothetical protein [Wolbachia endosymbiont (group B) of Aricia artaxerxes]|uniref:hypothetical protein n=1 Tax=Wolbachia endosymbiont (group B) of Aricia artaxerxes TaxID=3066166 RepID=UPI003132A318